MILLIQRITLSEICPILQQSCEVNGFVQQRKLHVRLNENCSEQVPYRSPDYPIYINRALLS